MAKSTRSQIVSNSLKRSPRNKESNTSPRRGRTGRRITRSSLEKVVYPPDVGNTLEEASTPELLKGDSDQPASPDVTVSSEPTPSVAAESMQNEAINSDLKIDEDHTEYSNRTPTPVTAAPSTSAIETSSGSIQSSSTPETDASSKSVTDASTTSVTIASISDTVAPSPVLSPSAPTNMVTPTPATVSSEVSEQNSDKTVASNISAESGVKESSVGDQGSHSSNSPSPTDLTACPSTSTCGTIRRNFSSEFKQQVLKAFHNDPECIGNQRATARKFGIHRRQVQKWLQQSIPIQNQNVGLKVQNKERGGNSVKEGKSVEKIAEGLALANKINVTSSNSVQASFNMPINTTANCAEKKRNEYLVEKNSIPEVMNLSKGKRCSTVTSSTTFGKNSVRGGISYHGSDGHSRNGYVGYLDPSSICDTSLSKNSKSHVSNESNSYPSLNNINLIGCNSIDLIDELCAIYPSEDFSLLKKAMIKKEVSLTKLPLNNGNRSSSNGSSPSASSNNDFVTQQTLQIIRRQNEYLQLLQQSGRLNFPSDGTNSMDPSMSKYMQWFNPIAHAAAVAAGLNVPTGGNNTNGGSVHSKTHQNGFEKDFSHHLSSHKSSLNDNTKAKTVAAALAASREAQGINHVQFITQPKNGYHAKGSKRNAPKRKSSTRKNKELQKEQQMSLEKSYVIEEPLASDLDTQATSDSVNSILEEDSLHKSLKAHFSSGRNSGTTNLENFVQNVLPVEDGKHVEDNVTQKSNGNGACDSFRVGMGDSSKELILKAFNSDAEVAGDARAVARKFGINVRVVMKCLREGPAKIKEKSPESNAVGEDHNANTVTSLPAQQNASNKRKKSKPNQICELSDSIEDGPLDMIVPIKKRRVSSSPNSKQ